MKTVILLGTIAIALLMAVPAMAQDVILPHRVIDAKSNNAVVDFEGLLARCESARVVILGENHDDPNTHAFELAMLQGLQRRKGDVILSMEMFERDVQEPLTKYVSGEITENDFMTWGHPWLNYKTDYRPLIEFAKANKIAVVAANVPRPMATLVSHQGYAATTFPEDERAWTAKDFDAPLDEYWDIFSGQMLQPGMMGMGGMTEETVKLFYEAQVMKDETMAESIAMAAEKSPDATVYHITGSFHMDNYFGTYARVAKRLPGADMVSIKVIPVDDLLEPLPTDLPKADYYILVIAPPAEESEEAMPPMPMPMPPTSPSSGTMPPKS